jgi:DNA polymerase-1
MPSITYEVPEYEYSHLIVDAESLAYRAYFGFTRKDYIKKTSQGYYSGCFYGFFSWLAKRYQYYRPDEMIICWGDDKDNLERRKILPSYKTERPKTYPLAFQEQIRDIKLALKLLGFKQYFSPGYEGDDTIATIVTNAYAAAHSKNKKIAVISQDKDLLQLVNEKVVVVQLVKGNTVEDKVFDIEGVIHKYKIHPSLLSDYLTLVGDKGDGVPPISKIGPERALQLISKYGPIVTWFDRIEELDIPRSIKKSLLLNKKQLIINKKLVCLTLAKVPLIEINVVLDNISIDELFKIYEVDVCPYHFLFFD